MLDLNICVGGWILAIWLLINIGIIRSMSKKG